jgi:hypothetical protein
MTDMTFDDTVKWQKAVEWLLANDAIVRAAAEHAKTSPVAAILIGAKHGEYFASKIEEIAKRMEVTEQERIEGYPLPENEAERIRWAQVRAYVAGLSQRND